MSITGFTLELDGPPAYVERILRAAQAEHARVIRDATDERARFIGGTRGVPSFNPVRGTLSVRSKI